MIVPDGNEIQSDLTDHKETEYREQTERMARQALGMARDDLLLHMRFFAASLHRLKPVSRPDSALFAVDGEKLYYDPMLVLKMYEKNPVLLSRCLLHSVLHCLFAHPFRLKGMDREKWEIAADAAVEAADIVLIDDDPVKLAEGIRLARRTQRIVKENIVFSILIKALVMILGAFGLVPLWLAVFSDVGVCLLAICNAMR